MSKREFKEFHIPIGLPVQFYVDGDTNHPIPAQVALSSNGMRCKLNLFPSGGDVQRTREFVRHCDDPWVAEHPHMVRGASHGVVRGTWGFVPGLELSLEPVKRAKVEKAKPSEKLRKEEGLARAKEFLEGGMEVDAAHNKVKSFGVSKDEVGALAADYALANA